MPRLNRTGDLWCSGIAGAGFYGGDFDERGNARLLVEQQNAGMRGFLNDEMAVTQFQDNQILGVNVRTNQRVIVDHEGASEVQANGGVWAAFFRSGVRTSTGLHFPEAYIGASTGPMRNDCVGPDGSVAIKDQYHSFGPWHVFRPDGTSWLLSEKDACNIQLLGGNRVIFREGWTWVGMNGVPAPNPITRVAWHLKLVDDWIIYQADDGRVLAHPNNNFNGIVLGQVQDAYGLDAIRLPDGRFRVMWATTAGEVPNDIVTVYFRVDDRRELLSAIVKPPPPEEEPELTYPPELEDQLPLIKELRRTLFPDFEGKPLNDANKAFLITKHAAWRLRHLGIGLVKAKAGSDNNVDGYTSDILALKDGQHWDCIQASEEAGNPSWSKVDNAHNGPIVARWSEPLRVEIEIPDDDDEEPPRDDEPPKDDEVDETDNVLEELLKSNKRQEGLLRQILAKL